MPVILATFHTASVGSAGRHCPSRPASGSCICVEEFCVSSVLAPGMRLVLHQDKTLDDSLQLIRHHVVGLDLVMLTRILPEDPNRLCFRRSHPFPVRTENRYRCAVVGWWEITVGTFARIQDEDEALIGR